MSAFYKFIVLRWTVVGMALATTLIGIGVSGFLTEIALSQSRDSSEKEWQFDKASGTPIWIVSNKGVGNPPLRRDIYILLEPEYFKREILTEVFTSLSRKISDVNWIVIEAYSDKETLRQMMIINELDGADYNWRALSDDAKKRLGLPVNSSVKKERVLQARYYVDPSKEFFRYTSVTEPDKVEDVVLREEKGAIESRSEEMILKIPPGEWKPDIRDKYGWTQLLYELRGGYFDSARMSIMMGAGANECSPKRICPLMLAAMRAPAEVISLLIAKGAKIDAKDEQGYTALMYAAENGNKDAVKILLQHGADVNAKDNLSQTALIIAGKSEVTELLLKAGAEIDATDYKGHAALMRAVSASNLEKVKLLLKWGAKADAKDKRGYTALDAAMLAQRSGVREAEEIIKLLEEAIAKQKAYGSGSKR